MHHAGRMLTETLLKEINLENNDSLSLDRIKKIIHIENQMRVKQEKISLDEIKKIFDKLNVIKKNLILLLWSNNLKDSYAILINSISPIKAG